MHEQLRIKVSTDSHVYQRFLVRFAHPPRIEYNSRWANRDRSCRNSSVKYRLSSYCSSSPPHCVPKNRPLSAVPYSSAMNCASPQRLCERWPSPHTLTTKTVQRWPIFGKTG